MRTSEIFLFMFISWIFLAMIVFPIGYAIGAKKERLKSSPIIAFCPCGHTIGEHENGSGSCQADIRRPHYDSIGSRNGYKWVHCACVKYYGPQPVTDFFSPGIMIADQ